MKVIGKFLLIILIILCVLLLTKNFIIKTAAEQGVGILTGLRLNMQSLSVSLLQTNVHIEELKILNPRGFQEEIMLHMPEILIDYNLTSILKGIIHLESMVINLTEFNVVKNKDGELNLDSLKVVQEGKEKKEKPEEPKEKKKGKALKLQIDHLELIVGKVSFQDYSKGGEPSINDFEFNLKEEHKDVTNPQIIIALILQKAMLKASIAKISGFELGGLQDSLSGALGDVSEIGTKAIGSAKELTSGVMDSVPDVSAPMEDVGAIGESAKEIAGGASDAVKEQAEKLKGLTKKIKLPLGGE